MARVKNRKSPQDKGLLRKIILVPVLISIICSVLYLVYSTNQTKSSIEAIKLIKPYVRADGTINDFQGVVGVKDSNDIRLYYDDDRVNGKVKIVFGKIPITCTWKEFKTKEFQNMLALISISAKQYKNGKVVLEWCGKKIERYVD